MKADSTCQEEILLLNMAAEGVKVWVWNFVKKTWGFVEVEPACTAKPACEGTRLRGWWSGGYGVVSGLSC